MVYSVDMVHTVNMVYTVDMVYIVDMVYTIGGADGSYKTALPSQYLQLYWLNCICQFNQYLSIQPI